LGSFSYELSENQGENKMTKKTPNKTQQNINPSCFLTSTCKTNRVKCLPMKKVQIFQF